MATTLKPADIIGKAVRLHSQLWTQGYCDGICTGYEAQRGVFFFRRNGQQLDEGSYEVRDIAQFQLL